MSDQSDQISGSNPHPSPSLASNLNLFVDTAEEEVEVKRKYNRISSSPSAKVSELRLARRVADVQDAEYGMVLLLTIIATVILWASTYVREAHSTLLPWNSVGTKVFLTALVVACSSVAWAMSRHRVRARVTAEWLRAIPVFASAVSLLLTVYILAKGWRVLALLMAMCLFADASHVYKLGEDAEFAAVSTCMVVVNIESLAWLWKVCVMYMDCVELLSGGVMLA